ncbi:hypothetical protein KY495_16965 [Massilia sp. PAMC28688]|uniref:alpha/beta hydrolase domain-containing protein n=1 Tax=Massilia sp. PAMC28688 TaxID=2861283 RepID=UPI001C635278|nr:alpha/beta hydrolase domain-containing protein [Massilia sp. PAMC28688]QYF92430.1 hypothetical protein KY495_16965 [Massilia sp. PAMC28688]
MFFTRLILCLAPAFLAACATPAIPDTDAGGVERLDIISRTPAFAGAPFEVGGAYETIVAVAHLRANPRHVANRGIVDIDHARGADGWVRYKTDVVITRPVEAARASRVLLLEIPNRGNALLPLLANDAATLPGRPASAGNGYTMRRGHAMVWVGWQGDIPLAQNGSKAGNAAGMQLPLATIGGQSITGPSFAEVVPDTVAAEGSIELAYPAASLEPGRAVLTVRAHATAPATTLPEAAWRYASPTSVVFTRAAGFDAGAIYRFAYQARDARPMGLGMAALRDVTAYLKLARAGNPLADIRPDVAVAVGVSQSGRVLRDFLWQGFNRAPDGSRVFDAAMPLIAGSRKSFVNVRFAQPGRYSTQHLDHLTYGDQFPFSYAVTRDPVSGRTDGIFARCQASATCPVLMHVDSSVEFWQGRASLVVSDGAGHDLPMPPSVRTYLMSSTQHIAAERPATGICRYPSNPARQGPVVRVLLDHLVAWARSGTEPPASRFPRHADAMLTAPTREASGFPDLRAIGVHFPQVINELSVVGYEDGVARPDRARPYQLHVPMTDADGHDIAGIRLPDIAVPLATHTGWNLRRQPFASGQLCNLNGSYIALPASAQAGDPRPPLAARYRCRMEYAKAVALAARELRDQGLMLQEDVDRYIARALNEQRVP